jgi:CRP-like cAMP-binding protein
MHHELVDNGRNRLLRALEPSDFALLRPHLRAASFAQGVILQEQETAVEHVYFPLSGMISLETIMQDGEVVETAAIGREGVLGAFAGLGPWDAFTRAIVQIPLDATAISTPWFQVAASQSGRIRDLILRYKEGLLAEVQQTAACNALHPLEARLARRLLQALDRAEGPDLPLTQDALAHMLAVRRTTVTLVAAKFQDVGLIKQRRGRVVILNRPGLEKLVCECYGTIRRRMDTVFASRELDRPGLPIERWRAGGI